MDADRFRELLSHWAATIGVIAVRDDARVYGTTITSFTPVAVDPPVVLVSLGPHAQVVPFLETGTRYTINLLDESQERIAAVYADPFPVGPSPFPKEGDPLLEGALVTLVCDVASIVHVDAATRLIVGRVVDAQARPDGRPLLWYQRGPTRLIEGER